MKIAFSIIIPCYNESQNILNLIDEISNSLRDFYDYEIIVINDDSSDDKKYINNKSIIYIKNLKKLGQSKSILNGILKSTNNVIVTIDGDGQNPPKYINKLIDIYFEKEKFALVAGIRLKRHDSIIKIISSRLSNFIRNLILKDQCVDTGCSLKVFNKEVFLNFPFFDGIHRFLPALFIGKNQKVKYVPVGHRKRIYGKSNYGTMDRLFRGIRDIQRVRKIIKEFNH